ncbi:MAG TPA: MarR family transcriptional regulator [Steroidobacteraceae bacterium]|nr:MarR family transcriptional regulator [Steroidobacteraceae bacterium]
MDDVYDPRTIDLRNCIGPLTGRVRAALKGAIDEALAHDEHTASYEVSAAQFLILSTLHSEGGESACELCKLMDYDRGAMSRMIDRLEHKGLVRRVRRSDERRMIALRITREGEVVLPKMQVCVVRVLNRFVRGISRSEVRQAESVLRRMLVNGGAAAG